MSVLLRTQGLAKIYGNQVLFDGVGLGIEENERRGIIGPNGVGKSTLLKVLAGMDSPDTGEVILRKGLHLTYVPQMTNFPGQRSVMAVVEAAAADAGLASEECHGAANVILGKVGFLDLDKNTVELSGGWKKRLTLACGLVGNPEVVLFDEPTNHLDTKGVLWLEDLLCNAPFAWLLVSHDRYFLDRTAHSITELNPIFPEGLLTAQGNYANFIRRRAEFLLAQQHYRESLANKVRRETDWLRAGVKARTTKANYRINSAHSLIDELEELKRRTAPRETKIAFTGSDRQTKKLIETQSLCKTLGDSIIARDLELTLSPGKRIGLLGINGTGKTSILRLLMGELAPDSGMVFRAPNLKLVYFDQERAQLDQNMTLKLALSPTGGDSVVYQGREVHLLSWAKRFKFSQDQLPLTVSRLSGGEQARLLISRLMLQTADVLLLDEPTNDLDIPTLELLEESLLNFAGSLVLVTHDRFMLNTVCNSFIGLDGSGQGLQFADYDQWERSLRNRDKLKKKMPARNKSKEPKTAKKASYKEQREWEGMEQAILVAESHLAHCQDAANDPSIASNGAKLMEAHTSLSKAEEEVARLYDRWAELGEKRIG